MSGAGVNTALWTPQCCLLLTHSVCWLFACLQNLENWRQYNGRNYDFTLLDRNKGAGWDLAQKLLAKRNKYNRGRYSVEQALRHRFFLPDLF